LNRLRDQAGLVGEGPWRVRSGRVTVGLGQHLRRKRDSIEILVGALKAGVPVVRDHVRHLARVDEPRQGVVDRQGFAVGVKRRESTLKHRADFWSFTDQLPTDGEAPGVVSHERLGGSFYSKSVRELEGCLFVVAERFPQERR